MKWMLFIMMFAFMIVSSWQVVATATGAMNIDCSVNDTNLVCGETARISCTIDFNDPFGKGVEKVTFWINSLEYTKTTFTTGNRTQGTWTWDISSGLNGPRYYMFDYITAVPIKVGEPYTGYSEGLQICSNKDLSNPSPGDYDTHSGCHIDFTPDDLIEIYASCNCDTPALSYGACQPDPTSETGGRRTVTKTLDPLCPAMASTTEPCTLCDSDIYPTYGSCLGGSMLRVWTPSDPACCTQLGKSCVIPADVAISCAIDTFRFFNELQQSATRSPRTTATPEGESIFRTAYDNVTLNFDTPEWYEPIIGDFNNDGISDIIMVNASKYAISMFEYWKQNFSLEYTTMVKDNAQIVGSPGYYEYGTGATATKFIVLPLLNSTGNSSVCFYQLHTVTAALLGSTPTCFVLSADITNSGVYCDDVDDMCYFKTKRGTTHIANKVSRLSTAVSSLNLTVNASGGAEIGWDESNQNIPLFTNFFEIGDVNEVVWTVPISSGGNKYYVPIATNDAFTRSDSYQYPPTYNADDIAKAPTDVVGYPVARKSGTIGKGYWYISAKEGSNLNVYQLTVMTPSAWSASMGGTTGSGIQSWIQQVPTGLGIANVVCKTPVNCFVTNQTGSRTGRYQAFWNGEGYSQLNFTAKGIRNNPPTYFEASVYWVGELGGYYYGQVINSSSVTSSSPYLFYNPSTGRLFNITSVKGSGGSSLISEKISCGFDKNGIDTACYMFNDTGIQQLWKMRNFDPTTLQKIVEWDNMYGVSYNDGELFLFDSDTSGYPWSTKETLWWWNTTAGTWSKPWYSNYEDCVDSQRTHTLVTKGTKWFFIYMPLTRGGLDCHAGPDIMVWGDVNPLNTYSYGANFQATGSTYEAEWVGDNSVYLGTVNLNNYTTPYRNFASGLAKVDLAMASASAECRSNPCFITQLSSSDYVDISFDDTGAGCAANGVDMYCTQGSSQLTSQWTTFQNSKALNKFPSVYNGQVNTSYNKLVTSVQLGAFQPMVFNFDDSADASKEVMYGRGSTLYAKTAINLGDQGAQYDGYYQISQAAVCDINFDGTKEYIAVFRDDATSAPYQYFIKVYKFTGGDIEEVASRAMGKFGCALNDNDCAANAHPGGNIICDDLDDNPYDMEIAFKDSYGHFYMLKYNNGFTDMRGTSTLGTYWDLLGDLLPDPYEETLERYGAVLQMKHSTTLENNVGINVIELNSWGGNKAIAFLNQEDDETVRLWVFDNKNKTYSKKITINQYIRTECLHFVCTDWKESSISRAEIVAHQDGSKIIVAISSISTSDGGDILMTDDEPESKFLVFKKGTFGIDTDFSQTFTPEDLHFTYEGSDHYANALLYPFSITDSGVKKIGFIREGLNPSGPHAGVIGKIQKSDVVMYGSTYVVENTGSIPYSMTNTYMPDRDISYLPSVFDKDLDGNDEIFWAGRSEDFIDARSLFIAPASSGGIGFEYLPNDQPSAKYLPIVVDLNNDNGLDFLYYNTGTTTRVYTASQVAAAGSPLHLVVSKQILSSSGGDISNIVEGKYGTTDTVAVEFFVGDDTKSQLKVMTADQISQTQESILTTPSTSYNRHLYGFDLNGDGTTDYVSPYAVIDVSSRLIYSTLYLGTDYSAILPVNLDADGYTDLFYYGSRAGAYISSPDVTREASIGPPSLMATCTVTDNMVQVTARYTAPSLSGISFKAYLEDKAQALTYKILDQNGILVAVFDAIVFQTAGVKNVTIKMFDAGGTELISNWCTGNVKAADIPTPSTCYYVEDFFSGDDPRQHGWTMSGSYIPPVSGYFSLSSAGTNQLETYLMKDLECPTSDLFAEIGYELSDDADVTFAVDGYAESVSSTIGQNYAIGYLRMQSAELLNDDGLTLSKVGITEDDLGYNWNASRRYRVKLAFNSESSQTWSAYRTTAFTGTDITKLTWDEEEDIIGIDSSPWVKTFVGNPDFNNVVEYNRFRINVRKGTIKLYYIRIYALHKKEGVTVITEHPGVDLLRNCSISEWCTFWGSGRPKGLAGSVIGFQYCTEDDMKQLSSTIPASYNGGCFNQLLHYCVNTTYRMEYNIDTKTSVIDGQTVSGKYDFTKDEGINSEAVTYCSMVLSVTEGTGKFAKPVILSIWRILWAQKIFLLLIFVALMLILPLLKTLKRS